MQNLNLLAFIVPEIPTFIRTDGHGHIDSAIDPDQEYVYTLYGREHFLVPVTNFSTNLVYPFALRVMGKVNKNLKKF